MYNRNLKGELCMYNRNLKGELCMYKSNLKDITKTESNFYVNSHYLIPPVFTNL